MIYYFIKIDISKCNVYYCKQYNINCEIYMLRISYKLLEEN